MPLKIRVFVLLCNLCLVVGCYKNSLYVQEEWVDRDFLASTVIKTPDPRQEHPPKGQRLLVGWYLLPDDFALEPTLHVSVWLWDNTIQEIVRPLLRRRSSEAFFFPNDTPGQDKRILTYRVEILSAKGELMHQWEHHLWTQMIQLQ